MMTNYDEMLLAESITIRTARHVSVLLDAYQATWSNEGVRDHLMAALKVAQLTHQKACADYADAQAAYWGECVLEEQ